MCGGHWVRHTYSVVMTLFSLLLLHASILLFIVPVASSRFRPNIFSPGVLNGYPLVVQSGHKGLPPADILFRIYLPLHKGAEQLPTHRCTHVNIQQAVPMAEAVALSFEMLREARQSRSEHLTATGALLDFSLGYELHDTCSSVPVYLTQLDGLFTVSDGHTRNYHSSNFSLCKNCHSEKDAVPENSDVTLLSKTSCTMRTQEGDVESDMGSPELSGSGSSDSLSTGFYGSPQAAGDRCGSHQSDANLGGAANFANLLLGPSGRVLAPVVELLRVAKLRQLHIQMFPEVQRPQRVVAASAAEDDGAEDNDDNDVFFSASNNYGFMVEALLAVCREQQWTHISVIVSDSSQHLRLLSMLKVSAKAMGICMVSEHHTTLGIATSTGTGAGQDREILRFFRQLKNWPAITTLLVLADEVTSIEIWRILTEAEKESNATIHLNGWHWIGFQDWAYVAQTSLHRPHGNTSTTTYGNATTSVTALRVATRLWAPLPPSISSWDEVRQRLERRLKLLRPSAEVLKRNPWLAPVWEEVEQCHLTCQILYKAGNESSEYCATQSEYDCRFPHVRYGKRDVIQWDNCTDSTLTSVVASAFHLDRSLNVMNTIFMVAHATDLILEEMISHCSKASHANIYGYSCHKWNRLLLTGKKKKPRVLWFLVEYVLTPSNYHRILRRMAHTYRDCTHNTEPSPAMQEGTAEKDDDGVVASSSSRRRHGVTGALNIEQAVMHGTASQGSGWRMVRIGTVQRYTGNHGNRSESDYRVDMDMHGGGAPRNSTCNADCPSGTAFVFPAQLRTCCFFCEPCPPGSVRSVHVDKSCQHCPAGTVASRNQSVCIQYPLLYSALPDAGPALILTLSLLGIAAVILTAVVFHLHRKNRIVKSADVVLSRSLFLTLLLSFICVNVLAMKPSNSVCVLQMALALIWPVIYVSSLAVKTNRLRVVFRHTSRMSQRSVRYLSNKVQLFLIVLVASMLACYLLVWGLVQPPFAEIIYRERTRRLVCHFNGGWMAGYFACTFSLIALTSALAFSTRKLPSFFNEAALLCLATALILACWIVLIPAYYFSQEASPSIVLAVIILVQGYCIFCSLFIRRLYY
eukprot:scpid29726/ scgid33156/ Extracellular calcium-sensing receptor; Parathyroid cell calcium-sensing receptor